MQSHVYERPLTLFDILGSVFRYRWRVVLVTGLMLVLSATAVFLFPKKYESEAKLFVRLGRGSAAMDPATVGQTISIQESREAEMNSIVDMLQSRGLAERVVDEIGTERILQRYSWIELRLKDVQDLVGEWMENAFPTSSAPSESGISAEEIKANKRRELAIKQLRSDLRIESPKKSTTISIAFRGAAPEVARDVVQMMIECYGQMHIDAYRSGGALDFFDQQFVEQEAILVRAERALREAKNENQIVTMKGKQESLQSEITDVRKMQLQTQAELQAARGRLTKLQNDFNVLPSELVSAKTSGIAVGATDAMRDRLYGLEILEKELSAKYSATHPELVKVREQLRAARSIMDAQPTERVQRTQAINPVHQQIQNEMLLAEATVASLEAKSSAIDTLEKALAQRLNEVNDLELMSESLQREIDIGREKHRNYARKLEESRINAALDQMSLSNVSIVSKPTLRFKHASPSRPLLAALGIIFSCCCGLATAIASDYSATAKDVQAVREAERARYLKMLELETLQAEKAAAEARQALAASSNGKGNISVDSSADPGQELSVELITKNGE